MGYLPSEQAEHNFTLHILKDLPLPLFQSAQLLKCLMKKTMAL